VFKEKYSKREVKEESECMFEGLGEAFAPAGPDMFEGL